MTPTSTLSRFRRVRADIAALILSPLAALALVLLFASACADDARVTPDAAGTGGAPGTSDASPETAGASCEPPSRVLRYTAPGCGAAAPAPTCGASAMDACLRGHYCACDGTVVSHCDRWSPKPWAYELPLGFQGTRCDPTTPTGPDGGARGADAGADR